MKYLVLCFSLKRRVSIIIITIMSLIRFIHTILNTLHVICLLLISFLLIVCICCSSWCKTRECWNIFKAIVSLYILIIQFIYLHRYVSVLYIFIFVDFLYYSLCWHVCLFLVLLDKVFTVKLLCSYILLILYVYFYR